MARTLRLGTRRSTLAWAQSLWVANRVRTLDSSVAVELVPIETQGDLITNVPLSKIEGKDFFTAELDRSLLDKRVDMSVHSLKDLSLVRPAGIQLAAIPPRENPRDVIIFRADAPERRAAGKPLRIGTSAPRRLENIPKFLSTALPASSVAPSFVEIRGNVDTRLGRLHEPEGSERALEGVVLAFAGLARLWRDEKGREKLRTLLNGTRWMVLPIAENPPAPGQGALAIECRSDDAPLLELLGRLNDPRTAHQVKIEREQLARYGGGCHQKFGAVSVTHPTCGDVLYVRGKSEDNRPIDEVQWLSLPPSPTGTVTAWDGLKIRETAEAEHLMDAAITQAIAASRAPVFIAHSRALPPGAESALKGRRVWTSGTASWRRLAERGVWVEGCADALGFDWIEPTLDEAVLQLSPLEDWQILTHAAAIETWTAGHVLATYTVPEKEARTIPDAGKITHAFWASGSQFRQHGGEMSASVHHACGPGKTAELIKASGVTHLTVFPSVEEWRRWLNLKT